ncbi:hypothetical protein O6H91_06G019800 [Diphasiastrum complanatum]|uniref:Uncharacterized protein n=1 Tax=Diphasiastrum complanatum TaxID=34168 RepID=A0ACC2DBL2_DIPCM|nr:hypothetical protein O6H91_06G019800 [Diphasiastrum complanatum]
MASRQAAVRFALRASHSRRSHWRSATRQPSAAIDSMKQAKVQPVFNEGGAVLPKCQIEATSCLLHTPVAGNFGSSQLRFALLPELYGGSKLSRTYSAADLPAHQEIGMPSLSPTMTQGNIAKWSKKEGDKVAAGDVLCEIETDKATLEMESMEEGYLAKILLDDGTKDIPVGKPIAIFVENEEDVAKFNNYQGSDAGPSTSSAVAKEETHPAYQEPEVQTGTTEAESLSVAHQKIGMPSLSPTMTQGNIAKWRKNEGDQVSAGDVLCEIETDKATLEMESMEDGYLAKILLGDGSKDVPVGKTIAIVVENKEDVSKFSSYKDSGSGPTEASTTPKEATSPPKKETPSQPASKKPEGGAVKADAQKLPGPSSSPSQTSDYTDIPVTQIRRVIAQRLLLSKQTIPHYYLTVDAKVDKLVVLRMELNSKLEGSSKSASEGQEKKKLSLNDFIIKAAALALRKVPQCNSSWTDNYIRQYNNVNISVAVQSEQGLFVPVIKDADKKGLSTIAEEVKLLAEKAKQNNLKPTDYEGGTFTVSNLGGPFNIHQFSAIVNPPQACILAVGTTEKRVLPSSQKNEYEAGTFISATLSCDHRVADGAIGAQWLAAFKGYIEDPSTLLL